MGIFSLQWEEKLHGDKKFCVLPSFDRHQAFKHVIDSLLHEETQYQFADTFFCFSSNWADQHNRSMVYFNLFVSIF